MRPADPLMGGSAPAAPKTSGPWQPTFTEVPVRARAVAEPQLDHARSGRGQACAYQNPMLVLSEPRVKVAGHDEGAFASDPTLLVGDAQLIESSVPAGVRELAAAVRSAERT